MHRLFTAISVAAFSAGVAFAQAPAARTAAARPAAAKKAPLVEFEMMTWPEVKAALAAGKTTALVYTGGTEQRGPQNVNGGHTLMGREIVRAIALRLGNAIAMPVLPYTPNNASADLPGTIGLTPELLSAVLERVSEQVIATGFKNVILMGDHGGGQPDAYATTAKKLDEKYAPKGIHVYFCDEVYKKAQDDFDEWLAQNGYPRSSHAGIPDTSTMIYLGGDKGWVRKELIPTAEGDPVPPPGARGQGRGRGPDPNAPPRKNNGITGDARRSTAALAPSTARSQGKEPNIEFEMMTWPEVKAAMEAGKTTALFYTGGTEQRGPQNVNGGHTLMARATVKAIALRLGNAIAMPVLPYTPNNANAALPGTIGLTPEILGVVLERVGEEAIKTGFKTVIFMQDHGGGTNVYGEVATKLDTEFAPQGVRVFFCDEVYAKAQGDFDKWLVENGYPSSSHAGIPDTSEMWYLGGELWTRSELLKTAVGDTLPRGTARDPNVPRVSNGITGDARRSSKELGKKAFEQKIDYAVRQIQTFIPPKVP